MRNSSPVRNVKQPLFLKRYTYWKEATIAFKKHHTSDWHCEAMEVLLVLPQCTTDLANLQIAVNLFTKSTQIKLRTLILQRSPGGMSPYPPSCSTLRMFDCSTQLCQLIPPNNFYFVYFTFSYFSQLYVCLTNENLLTFSLLLTSKILDNYSYVGELLLI